MLNSLRPSVVLYEGGFQYLNNEILKLIQDDKLDNLNCASYIAPITCSIFSEVRSIIFESHLGPKVLNPPFGGLYIQA